MRGGTRRRWTDDDDDNDNDIDNNNDNDNNDDDNDDAKGGDSNGTVVRQRYGRLVIGILRVDQGSYMLRVPLGLALAFDHGR